MRLESVFDALYALGSLWGGLPAPRVCTVSRVLSTFDAAWLPASGNSAGIITAFVDVNVIPMDTERLLPHQTVLVEGNRITALGPAAEIKVPAGAVRIDGRDQYLMPGLGAMHGHDEPVEKATFTVEQGTVRASPHMRHHLARHLADGVTTLSIYGGPPLHLIQEYSRFYQSIPSPRPRFAAMLPRWDKLGSITAYVAAAKAAGYDHFITAGPGDAGSVKSASFDSLLAAARRVGIPVTMHKHHPPFEKLLALGTGGSADHLYAIYQDSIGSGDAWQQLPPDVLSQKMQTITAAIRNAGVWITPTLRCVVRNPSSTAPSTKFRLRFIKMLHDAGVRLLLARDDFWDAHDDLQAMVAAGLTPYEALVTGTRNIAQYFGQLDSIGTVTVGKRADLVLLAENPLTDVGHAREPVGVMIDGRWFDRTALDQALLAFPKPWLEAVIRMRGLGPEKERKLGGTQGEESRVALLALIDSLEPAKPKTAEYERLVRRFATELGALRALLPPEQRREWLDPPARAWLREQARQGHTVTIPGVASEP